MRWRGRLQECDAGPAVASARLDCLACRLACRAEQGRKDGTPGPGAYRDKDVVATTPAFTMGSRPRESAAPASRAPLSYLPSEWAPAGPAYTMARSSRAEREPEAEGPGPGAYAPEGDCQGVRRAATGAAFVLSPLHWLSLMACVTAARRSTCADRPQLHHWDAGVGAQCRGRWARPWGSLPSDESRAGPACIHHR